MSSTSDRLLSLIERNANASKLPRTLSPTCCFAQFDVQYYLQPTPEVEWTLTKAELLAYSASEASSQPVDVSEERLELNSQGRR